MHIATVTVTAKSQPQSQQSKQRQREKERESEENIRLDIFNRILSCHIMISNEFTFTVTMSFEVKSK